MRSPQYPSDESGRLAALHRFEVLDTPSESEFDDIALLASNICDTPISLISLLDSSRQWFKSRVGLEATETPRDISFCGHAIHEDHIFEVPDARQDPRFADNPLVTGDPNIRFYAGSPLITSDGFRLGTLCVIDRIPRNLTERQRSMLEALGRQVVRLFEARAMARELAEKSRFQAAVLDSPDLAMISTTPEGHITGFNHAAEVMLGYRPEEMIGRQRLRDCYAPDDVAAIAPNSARSILAATGDGKIAGAGEWHYQHRDGHLVPVKISITPIRDDRGTTLGYLSTARDTTARRRAENSHREALEFIQKIAERVPGMIYQFRQRADGTSCLPFASLGIERIYRTSPETVREDASAIFALVHPDDLNQVRASIAVSARDLTPWRHEYRIRFDDGTVHWLFGNALPQREACGAVLWHGFITDISEQKAAALALQHSRQFLGTLIDNLSVGIYTKRMQKDGGVFMMWNRAAEQMSGVRTAAVVGRTDREVFPDAMVQIHAEHDRQLLATKKPVTVPVYPVRHPDGTTRLLRMTSVPLLDAAGEVEYTMGIAEDITELLNKKKELRQRQAELEAVNDASPLGLYRTDPQGRCTYVNRTYEIIGGIAGQDALGSGWLQAVHPDDRAEVIRQWTEATRLRQRYDAVFRFMHADGHIVLVRSLACAVVVDDVVTGYVGTVDDITARRAASEAIAASEKRLRTITDNVPAMIGYIDAEERYRFCNTGYRTILNIDPQSMIGRTVRDVYGDTAYERMRSRLHLALSGERVSFERPLTGHGADRYLQCEYVPDKDADGKVLGFYALITDVTARRAAEADLADSEHRLRTITDNLPVAITYIDRALSFRFANATMHAWTDTRPETVVGEHLRDVLGPTLFAERLPYYEQALAGERVEFVKRADLFHQERVLQSTYIPDVASDGSIRGIFTLSSDITALKETEEELRRLARFDSLTGLPNRAHLYEALESAVERGKRQKSALGVLFLDIDHFKVINDTLGHRKGDLVLQEFASRLRKAVRTTDTVARLAGDEFVIVLESLNDCAEAELVAMKILKSVNRRWLLNGEAITVSTSVGIAFDQTHVYNCTDLVAHADAALYEAKAAGRNTHRIHSV